MAVIVRTTVIVKSLALPSSLSYCMNRSLLCNFVRFLTAQLVLYTSESDEALELPLWIALQMPILPVILFCTVVFRRHVRATAYTQDRSSVTHRFATARGTAPTMNCLLVMVIIAIQIAFGYNHKFYSTKHEDGAKMRTFGSGSGCYWFQNAILCSRCCKSLRNNTKESYSTSQKTY